MRRKEEEKKKVKITNYKLQITNKFQITMAEIPNKRIRRLPHPFETKTSLSINVNSKSGYPGCSDLERKPSRWPEGPSAAALAEGLAARRQN
jgi:hypothetical protein